MTTVDAFNTFAVRCEATDPNNVLGVTYGYLAEYDSYHSHSGKAGAETRLPLAA